MRRETLGLLEDIREAAGFIADDTAGATFERFERDRWLRQVVERNFEIVGEAVNRLRRQDPIVVERISAYRNVVGLRNALVHGYDVVDYPRLWRAVQESLPVLRAEVEALLAEAGNDGGGAGEGNAR
jgi:uncharacterized protein with HEPN domain